MNDANVTLSVQKQTLFVKQNKRLHTIINAVSITKRARLLLHEQTTETLAIRL